MAVEWFGDAIIARLKTAAMKGVINGTERVKDTMVSKVMNPPKTGRIYRRGGVSHQASAPGESPANDRGNLVKSITTAYDHDAVSGTVNVGAAYAEHLERGTERMAPRPFARPSLFENENEIRKDITDAIRSELS